ncbi:SET domain-containing protein-lysine N-methyltransferase [Nonomuraea sp. NPDC004580]|uniref:SET domain-containing protein n=1 Tax=Nonomuraea sp. NPDC004580 TaxID=3154552 RepID=UPI0033B2B29B
MTYDAESRLSPAAEPRRSPIEGTGLFAVERIRRGEVVMRLGGRVIDDDTLAALTPPYSSITVEDGVHLLLDPAHPVRYGNHSCDPTLWHQDATTLTARRDIEPGEELTVDYATHTGAEGWSMACRCGAPSCRGVVTGADWRSERLRQIYGTHWSPALLARMRAG